MLLGSNIDPAANLLRALEVLAESVAVVGASRVFETDPVAERPMPRFLNAALEIATPLEPGELKYGILRGVESRLGRKRTSDRNAPRTIDLDLVLFGDRVVRDRSAALEIPDPDILRHAHVILPLADLSPHRRHPEDGRTLAEIASGFGADCGVRFAPASERLVQALRRFGPMCRGVR